MISFNFLPFQVVQSLRLQSSSKNYSELGSCPTLNSSGTGPQQSNASAISSTSSSRPLLNRTLVDDASRPTEEFVQTATGRILVARQGDPSRPAIITYHDLGLNYLANFQVIALHGIISSWKYDCDELQYLRHRGHTDFRWRTCTSSCKAIKCRAVVAVGVAVI